MGQRHATTALYPRERPGTHFTGGWVGPRAGLDRCGKSRPPAGVRSPDHPACSRWLYRLSYWANKNHSYGNDILIGRGMQTQTKYAVSQTIEHAQKRHQIGSITVPRACLCCRPLTATYRAGHSCSFNDHSINFARNKCRSV